MQAAGSSNQLQVLALNRNQFDGAGSGCGRDGQVGVICLPPRLVTVAVSSTAGRCCPLLLVEPAAPGPTALPRLPAPEAMRRSCVAAGPVPAQLQRLPLFGGGFVLLDGVSIPATLELSENELR